MLSVVAIIGLAACERDLEEVPFHGYFYTPGDREVYLGLLHGLSACQIAAHSKAEELNMKDANWSYICCLKTNDSDCAEKHK